MNAQAASQKPTLAIISTYDDLCGIAGYTRKLVVQLEEMFDIEVFDLDQFFLRSGNARMIVSADAQIKDMCDRLPDFDYVNLQLEFGTLGYFKKDIVRRLDMIVTAANRMTVTFHTILDTPYPPYDRLRHCLFKFELYNSYRAIADYRQEAKFRKNIYDVLRRAQKDKYLSAIVHTRRDAKRTQYLDGLENVNDHPLAFVPQSEAEQLGASAHWRDFPILKDLPKDARVLSVFGFLGHYKGMHTAIAAMTHLPDTFHLAIFGGLHPAEINRSEDPHHYVRRLVDQINAEDENARKFAMHCPAIDIQGETQQRAMPAPPEPKRMRLRDRVHFMGTQSDAELEQAIAGSDIVIMPYFEVGQSASGPMSMALDLGARIIATRNHAFLEFEKYHPGRLSFFEIGNQLELAQRVKAESHRPAPSLTSSYNTRSNAALYRAAFTGTPALIDPSQS